MQGQNLRNKLLFRKVFGRYFVVWQLSSNNMAKLKIRKTSNIFLLNMKIKRLEIMVELKFYVNCHTLNKIRLYNVYEYSKIKRFGISA